MSAAASAMGATCFQVSLTSRFCSGVITLLMLAPMQPCVAAASVDRHKVLDLLAGQIDTDAAGCSACVRQAATSGIAASRLKVTAASAAVMIRVTFCIGTSIKLPARGPEHLEDA